MSALSDRIASQRAIAGDRTYADARRDAAYMLGSRCERAESTRDCPYNHLWTDAGAYHRGAALTTSPFTRVALRGDLQGKVTR